MKSVVKILGAGAAVIAASACIPQPPQAAKTLPMASANGCSARASAPWTAVGQTFTADAFTEGPSCAQAVAVIVIRNAKGETLWTDVFDVSHNMALATAGDVKAMNAALADWIKQDDPASTTASLPEWKAGADIPMSGEFPFYAEDGTTREDYAALRAKKLPMFCYVQGMESSACIALDGDALQKIGVQSFPG